jgi:hypothetical protein
VIILPDFTVGGLERLREDQGDTAGQSWILNPDILTLGSIFLVIIKLPHYIYNK